MEKTLPKRKNPRLKGFDYSTPSAYFVTICVKNHKNLLSKINVGRGLGLAESHFTKYGKIANEQILALEKRFPNLEVDKYVIMPNHIHILFSLYEQTEGASPLPTISQVVCAFKSITTINCKKAGFSSGQLFQTSFHDHIVRGPKDYTEIWKYIDTNEINWEKDCFYN